MHVPLMLVLDEGIAARFPRSLVVDDVDLEKSFFFFKKREKKISCDSQQDLEFSFHSIKVYSTSLFFKPKELRREFSKGEIGTN